jgi:hypothetical protein
MKFRYTVTGTTLDAVEPFSSRPYTYSEVVEVDDAIDVFLMLFQSGAIAEGIAVTGPLSIEVVPIQEDALH